MAYIGRSNILAVLVAAGAIGAVLGTVSTRTGQQGGAAAISVFTGAGRATGLLRRRPPQPGDDWGGCNDARAAGTAPIYRGEPGYRANMDGDDDGIACEPHPG